MHHVYNYIFGKPQKRWRTNSRIRRWTMWNRNFTFYKSGKLILKNTFTRSRWVFLFVYMEQGSMKKRYNLILDLPIWGGLQSMFYSSPCRKNFENTCHSLAVKGIPITKIRCWYILHKHELWLMLAHLTTEVQVCIFIHSILIHS